MKIYLNIYKNFKLAKYNKKFTFLYLFSIATLVLEIFSISLLIPIVGILLDTNVLDQYSFFKDIILLLNPLKLFLELDEQKNLLGGLCTLYFIVILSKNISLFFIMKYMTKITYDIGLEVKTDFLSKIIDMSYLKINKYKLSGLITYNNNIETIKESLIIILSNSIELILILGILCFLFFNSPQAMLMIVVITILLFLFNKFYLSNKLSYYSSQIQVNEKEQVNFLLTTLRGIKNIRLDNIKIYFLDKFKYHMNKSNNANFVFGVLSGSMRLLIEIMAAGLISGLIIFFILNDFRIEEIITTLAVFLAGGLKILPSLNKLTISYQSLQYAKDRMIDLNSFYESNLLDNKKIKSITFNNSLEVKNLNYIYEDGNIILENSNFNFFRGEKIYLKGESGSGKSTLMNIISGLIECDNGILKIDDNLVENQFRISNLSYITQKPFFTSDTIVNNICLGLNEEEKNLNRVVECLKDARIYNDIAKLPDNINTLLLNDGDGFSGGQLQRISLARLLYRNSNLIILDEFTNALDSANEIAILDTLFTKYKDKTIIIISHKEYKNIEFDKKYLIENKKIINY